ncbi:MAG: Adenine-specific DNA methylase [Candidatus Alkanophagales archaeon MCA70_species_1]|nr:Adenine-specific DNA methylase [Candidatus Alkanophaga volatiphilum]
MQATLDRWVGVEPDALTRSGILQTLGVVKGSQHTPAYTMHKFWARRPWIVFRTIIEKFTRPGDVILDPFAGGGVTLVEGLIARRKVIAVDLNPLACYIMRHEVELLNIRDFERAVSALKDRLEPIMNRIYAAKCPKCGSQAVVEWTEYDSASEKPLQMKIRCSCGFSGAKKPERTDLSYVPEPQDYPTNPIPAGDKTSDLLKKGYKYFYELFTRRNLAALTLIRREIERQADPKIRSFLTFAFTSTLKWASKMSHRRGDVIEGWAMHAYWIYPKYLEINVWKQFLNRCKAVVRGKDYTNRTIGGYAQEASSFDELRDGSATYMILQRDARRLPLPDESVDVVITDPPYGGNVNYAELSDYFLVWLGRTAPKEEEIIVHKTRNKTLRDYEEGLYEVFAECNRVLKERGLLISTFNSKDFRVVTAFLLALRRAGFTYLDVSFQPYLKTYETTFHAIYVDSMPFDFVFAFRKEGAEARARAREEINPARVRAASTPESKSMTKEAVDFLKERLTRIVEDKKTEKDFRLDTYPHMIKLVNEVEEEAARKLAERYEKLVESQRDYFGKIRKEVISERKNKK